MKRNAFIALSSLWRLTLELINIPIAAAEMVLRIPHYITETSFSNPVYMAYTFFAFRGMWQGLRSVFRIRTEGLTGEGVPNNPELQTEPIWNYLTIYAPAFSTASLLSLLFVIGYFPIPWTVSAVAGFVLASMATVPRYLSTELKTLRDTKSITRANYEKARNFDVNFNSFAGRDLVVKRKWATSAYWFYVGSTATQGLALVAVGLIGPILLVDIPLHWFVWGFTVILSWLAGPFVAQFVSTHFKGISIFGSFKIFTPRWIPYVHWTIGFFALLLAFATVPPGFQVGIAHVVEVIQHTPMGLASMIGGGDTAFTVYGVFLGVGAWYVVLHTILLAGIGQASLFGLISSIGQIFHKWTVLAMARWGNRFSRLFPWIRGHVVSVAVGLALAVVCVASFASEGLAKSPLRAPATVMALAQPVARAALPSTLMPASGVSWILPSWSKYTLLVGGIVFPNGVKPVKGHALFADFRQGTSVGAAGEVQVDPAVGKILLTQLLELERIRTATPPTEKQAPVLLRLVFSDEVARKLKGADASGLLRSVLERAGAEDTLTNRVALSVLGQSDVPGEMGQAAGLSLQVIAPSDEAIIRFWTSAAQATGGMSLTLFLATLVSNLVSMKTIVFTGSEADLLVKSGARRETDGTVRVDAVGTPVQLLEQEQKAIALFKISA
jgi:hypothetical protein